MTKIKICGLFRPCDIDYVNEAQPDYIGFVFAKSRRQVSIETASALRAELIPSISPVGVFVNASIHEIVRLYKDNIVSLVQLHGNEDEDYITRLKQSCDIPIIKAVRVDSADDILKWQASSADFLLFDHGTGGTGKAFDWGLIQETVKPYFLAGGINAENIDTALHFNPFCIDVSSGAETDCLKNKEKIINLVRKVRKGY